MGQYSSDSDRGSRLVVQISDTHLCENPSSFLRGVNTSDCLRAVLTLATPHLRQADAILATGDISHDGSPASYRAFGKSMDAWGGLKRFLPGNHDAPQNLRTSLPQPGWPTLDTLGSWSLISVSTHLVDQEGGLLDVAQLDALASTAGQSGDRPALVAMHHPPISTGSPWLDKIGLINADEFQAVLQRRNNVRAVVFGHAHQEIDEVRHGIRFLGAPATCVQFMPNSDQPYSDQRLPGYRWLRLHSDGTLETGVERLQAWPPGSSPQRQSDG